MQRWHVIQHDLLPELRQEAGGLTPKLTKLIYVLEWVRIEQFTHSSWIGVGRPPLERAWLANAFVAKTVLGLGTTVGLIERLTMDRALRRICGFSVYRKLPSEATFSRAFEEFAQARLAERVHEALIQEHLGGELIGHLSRDGTAIEARERPARPPAKVGVTGMAATDAAAPKRGRPRRGEARPAPAESALQRQQRQTLAQLIAELPTACDRGTKCRWPRCCPRPRCTTAGRPFRYR
jgi:Transposase domain (DUF772)